MAEIRGVLFDLDGTLVDTAPDFYITMDRLLDRHRQARIDHVIIREHVSNGSRALTQLAFPSCSDQEQFERLRLELLDLYEALVGYEATLFEENKAILALLSELNMPWGVVTNKPRLYTELLFQRVSYLNQCSVLICADDVPKAKPDPTGIQNACKKLALAPQNVLYVGDHLRDVQAAHNAGCPSAVVPFGYFDADTDLDAWNADYLITCAADLQQIITESAV